MTRRPAAIAIVGAGISGLVCARELTNRGIEVVIFEKSRGVGGRMATRRAGAGLRFDHGAQYFTVRDDDFKRDVDSWIAQGVVKPWKGRLCTLTNGRIEWKDQSTARFVGVPGMNAICKHLADGVDIRFQTRVAPPVFEQGTWRLHQDDGKPLGEFDYFITSAPAPQSAELLSASPDLQRQAAATDMSGCWATMLAFEQSLELPFDGAFVHESPLSWVARKDAKPQRSNEQECWVLHASPAWTNQHIESEPDHVLAELLAAFRQAADAEIPSPNYSTAHRWRHAIPPKPLEERCLFDPQRRIGACGDWCNGPRVEGAFLSGKELAVRVLSGSGFARL